MEYPMEASKTSSTIPSCLRRTRQCRSNSRPRSAPPLSRSEGSLPANVPGSAPRADRATLQNTSGIFHIPLSPIYIPVAYSNLYASALGLQVFLGRGEPYLPSKGPQMCDAQQLKHLDGSFRHSPVPSDRSEERRDGKPCR